MTGLVAACLPCFMSERKGGPGLTIWSLSNGFSHRYLVSPSSIQEPEPHIITVIVKISQTSQDQKRNTSPQRNILIHKYLKHPQSAKQRHAQKSSQPPASYEIKYLLP